jgi:TolB-like protein
MVACLLAVALAAAPPKLVVLPVAAGEGVPESTAAAITEAVVAEVRRQSKAEVITQREIVSILSLESQKAMLGCATDACMAELGGALGADRLVSGNLAKLGESFLLHLRVVDAKKVRVEAQADRRLRGATIDGVLDVLPAMVAELFPGAPAPAPQAVAPPPAPAPAAVLPPPPPLEAAPPPAPPPTAGAAGPPVVGAALTKKAAGGWTEEEEKLPPDVRDRLWVLTDDDGLVIVVVPFQDGDAPFYAGDGEKLFRQRVVSAYREGNLAFDRAFWEPRARAGAEAQLSFRGGRATLTCGKRTIPLRVVGPGGSKKVLAEAKLYAPPFRRIPHLLARDDQGAYFLVDAARDPWSGRPATRQDLRLRYGRKGALAPVTLADTVSDPAGLVLVTPTGRLVARGAEVEWITAAGRTPLTPVDLRDAAPFVYGELGAYGARLGTPCDGKL